eukprot:TRINITY_DN1412_c0_g2_i1.p1 TRINITY_DN1412_c0_g2~~TRINITY_DN1412_c0_g2_i1.p1  ORF type:complete len:1136 (-),score=315.33 TRINITY_DN1412_c0_g2_i1:134-3208(-)
MGRGGPSDRAPRDRDGDRDRRGDARGGSSHSGGDRGYAGASDRSRPGGGSRSHAAVPPPSSAPQPGAPSGGGAHPPPLHVSGCSNDTVSNIIAGMYKSTESNHGKPVYKKEGGSVTVLIYYWDDRDGSTFNGWWFGPKVGGDQVWAYNSSNLGRDHVMPPTGSWKVPWDGKIDDRLKISVMSGQGGGAGGPSHSSAPMPSSAGASRGGQQRQDDEERRRRDADRERFRIAEEKRKREEEEDRRREEQRKRRQREEEEARRREAEARRKRQEEERKQEAAAGNVRKVLDRIRNATPDNFKELQAELDRAAAQNFQAMGSLRERVNDEMQNTLTQAQKRIAEEIKQREEQERRRKAEIERVEQLVKEAAEDVEAAEAKVSEAQAAAKTAADKSSDPEVAPAAVLEAVEVAQKESALAKEALERSEKILVAKQGAIGDGEGARHVKREVDELHNRLRGSQRAMDRSGETLEETHSRGLRRSFNQKKDQEWRECFTRHDADGDGCLSRTEVTEFGKSEFGFALSDEVLGKIMRVLEPINFEKFVPLRQKVAIAKSEADARTRREAEEEQKRQAEVRRQEVQQIIDDATSKIEAGEAKLKEAEESLRALAKDSDASSATMEEGIAKAEDAEKEAQEMLKALSDQLQEVDNSCADLPELKRLVRRDVSWLQDQQKRTEAHLEKLAGLVKNTQNALAQKAKEHVQQLRAQALSAVRGAMNAQGKQAEAIFEEINGGNALSFDSFVKFLKGLESLEELLAAEGEAERLFADVAGSQDSQIEKEAFLELIRMYYKCVKGTVLSEDISIKAKTIRRLVEGEVLEVLEGPSKEDGANVQRVRCLAVQDGATGWATIAGNQGTPFLVQGGNILVCVQAVDITEQGPSLPEEKSSVSETAEKTESAEKPDGEGTAAEVVDDGDEAEKKPAKDDEMVVDGDKEEAKKEVVVDADEETKAAASEEPKAPEAAAPEREQVKVVRRLEVGEVFEVLEFQRKDKEKDGEDLTRRARGKAKSDGAAGWVTIVDKDGNALLECR